MKKKIKKKTKTRKKPKSACCNSDIFYYQCDCIFCGARHTECSECGDEIGN